MSEAKGPYSFGLLEELQQEENLSFTFVYGPGLGRLGLNCENPLDAEDATVLANTAYAEGVKAGRASRDGLRKALEDIRDCNWTLWIGDRLDPVRYLACTALEADGGSK
jgi:hypothetical protein